MVACAKDLGSTEGLFAAAARQSRRTNEKHSLWKQGRNVSEPAQLPLEQTPQEEGGFSRLDVFLEVLLEPNTSSLASRRSSRLKFKDL